jgi:hypothetical protein
MLTTTACTKKLPVIERDGVDLMEYTFDLEFAASLLAGMSASPILLHGLNRTKTLSSVSEDGVR